MDKIFGVSHNVQIGLTRNAREIIPSSKIIFCVLVAGNVTQMIFAAEIRIKIVIVTHESACSRLSAICGFVILKTMQINLTGMLNAKHCADLGHLQTSGGNKRFKVPKRGWQTVNRTNLRGVFSALPSLNKILQAI